MSISEKSTYRILDFSRFQQILISGAQASSLGYKKYRLQVTVCTYDPDAVTLELYGYNCSVNSYMIISVIFPIGNSTCDGVHICNI